MWRWPTRGTTPCMGGRGSAITRCARTRRCTRAWRGRSGSVLRPNRDKLAGLERYGHHCFQSHRHAIFEGRLEAATRQGFPGVLVEALVGAVENANITHAAIAVDDRVQRHRAVYILPLEF